MFVFFVRYILLDVNILIIYKAWRANFSQTKLDGQIDAFLVDQHMATMLIQSPEITVVFP